MRVFLVHMGSGPWERWTEIAFTREEIERIVEEARAHDPLAYLIEVEEVYAGRAEA